MQMLPFTLNAPIYQIMCSDCRTGDTRLIRRNCDAYTNDNFDIHPGGNFLLVSRRHTYGIEGDYFAEFELVRMELDGSFEQLLYPK